MMSVELLIKSPTLTLIKSPTLTPRITNQESNTNLKIKAKITQRSYFWKKKKPLAGNGHPALRHWCVLFYSERSGKVNKK